jgi:N-acetylmuramic acid 6-phosphate etherase
MNTPMSQAQEKAREFLEHQKAFRLGELLTESSHPKTRRLSQTMATDIPAGIRLLQSVDEDIPPALERIFAQPAFGRLIEALHEAMQTGHHVFFTGCGATGRLSILLEAAWRRFWREMEPDWPPAASLRDRCISVMAGGDFALIKSVEGFEDFPAFGRHQLREAGVERDDVVVAITEGGETPFVTGTAWQGLEAGAHVFFVYNNPSKLLCRHVQRSREVIEEPRIAKLDLATGPMAITGSTRMQATTVELLVVGAALETALAQFLAEATGCHAYAGVGMFSAATKHVHTRVDMAPASTQEYSQLFGNLLRQLSSPQSVAALARAVEMEEQIYRRHGLVTYVADSLLLDVLTDTTERSPTFMVPPFRKEGDTTSPVSWAFVKDPHRATREAWCDMLQREPRGLTWGPDVYRQLNAPASVQANPPKLDNAEIYRFRIGNEPDASRTDAPDSLLIYVGDPGNHQSSIIHHQWTRTAALTFGPAGAPLEVDEHIHIACDLPASPLRLWEHLAIKLILNTLSTATMVRLGRVIGNAMVWLSPSNKKLIDRGCRLIVHETGCTYEHACEVLHEAIEEVARRSRSGAEVPSPVALAISRLAGQNSEYEAPGSKP